MTPSTPAPSIVDASELSPDWYVFNAIEVLSNQHVDPVRGLAAPDATARLADFGSPVFARARKEHGWRDYFVCQMELTI